MYSLLKSNDLYTIIDFTNNGWISVSSNGLASNWYKTPKEAYINAINLGFTRDTEDIPMSSYETVEEFCAAITSDKTCIDVIVVKKLGKSTLENFQNKYPELFI